MRRTECASEQLAGLDPPFPEEVTAYEVEPWKIGSQLWVWAAGVAFGLGFALAGGGAAGFAGAGVAGGAGAGAPAELLLLSLPLVAIRTITTATAASAATTIAGTRRPRRRGAGRNEGVVDSAAACFAGFLAAAGFWAAAGSAAQGDSLASAGFVAAADFVADFAPVDFGARLRVPADALLVRFAGVFFAPFELARVFRALPVLAAPARAPFDFPARDLDREELFR